ncbi:MAG: leucine-rich repeat protein [Oligosphaeraceae bacterium]
MRSSSTTLSLGLALLLALLLPGACGELRASSVSNTFTLDTRDIPVVTGLVYLAPSRTDATAVPQVDGAPAAGWTADSPYWDSSSVEDGLHTLSVAGESATPVVLTLNSPELVLHEGALDDDEVWTADKIHVVLGLVRIPEGRRLIIANGAIVKFAQGTGILNQGMLSSCSALLTALEDDTAGGDTNQDGDTCQPAEETFDITNEGTLTAIHNTVRYASKTTVFATDAIADGAFARCEAITQVVIPQGVLSVGANAFAGCQNLTRVTFLGNHAVVDSTTFAECDAIERVDFIHGLPEIEGAPLEFPLGDSHPLVYVNDFFPPDTWAGYPLTDIYATGILNQTLMRPEEEGEAGQVLTRTEEGYAWREIPVDDALDAASPRPLRNKAVTAAVGTLEKTDAALAQEIAALQDKDTALQGADALLRQDVAELQTRNATLQGQVDTLSRQLTELLHLLKDTGEDSQVLTWRDGEYGWQAPSLAGAVHTLRLEEGWNLVAIPGRIVVEESEKALLEQIEIYTFDKEKQTYVPADGLKPLACYWMRAPRPCTIHFGVPAAE